MEALAGPQVLLVEGSRTMSEALKQILEDQLGATVIATAEDASSAVDAVIHQGADLALVDLELSPGCDLVGSLRRLAPEMGIIVLADRDRVGAERLVEALAAGAVGALYKDSSVDELRRALGSSRRSPVVAGEAVGVLLGAYIDAMAQKRERDLATIASLATALEVKDVTTAHHVQRVCDLAQACLREIDPGLAANHDVLYGFMLHDVGKIGIPDSILGKPGPLDAAEWRVMRTHPELGVKILGPVGLPTMTTDIVLCHHERWDGTGYPLGLGGEDIPLTARVFSVADAFDAMTSHRPYRAAMRRSEACERVAAMAGRAYDPGVVEVFVDLTDVAD